MDLIIASNNQGKINEYKHILERFGFEIYSQKEKNIDIEVEETGTTFEENATLKAEAIYEKKHQCVLADDSGLEVEVLNNEPGIYSARYKGLKTDKEKRLAILEALDGNAKRKARFVCCICYIDETGKKHLFKATWEGNISLKEEGINGFGYDPIFIPEESNGRTVASMPNEFKETYSHRAKAVGMLREYLENNRG